MLDDAPDPIRRRDIFGFSPLHHQALGTAHPSRSGSARNETYNVFFRELTAFLAEDSLAATSALVLGESTSLYVFGNVFGLPQGSFVSQAAELAPTRDGLRAGRRPRQRQAPSSSPATAASG